MKALALSHDRWSLLHEVRWTGFPQLQEVAALAEVAHALAALSLLHSSTAVLALRVATDSPLLLFSTL